MRVLATRQIRYGHPGKPLETELRHYISGMRGVAKLGSRPIALALLLAFSAAPTNSSASETPPAGGTDQLAEVTVTAQKRTEDIKDIPFSVSAISGDVLAERHIANYDDITRTVPSVAFQAGPGPGLDNIEIRGVSSTSGSATVGIYIDESSVTVSNSAFDGAVQPKLFDLDRIEVLRGPQGTLYGASSMGGTIRFITKQPDLHSFSAAVSTDLSDTHHGGFNHEEYGILNIPVIEGVFALRIGADISRESGYIDRYTPTETGADPTGTSVLELGSNDSTGVLGRRGVNDVRTEVFRVVGKYAAPDDWVITPAFLYQHTAADDTNIFYPDIGTYEQDKRVAEPYSETLQLPTLTITKDFGGADLTSVTSYFKRDFRRTTDGTLYNSNIIANVYIADGSYSTPPTPTPTDAQLYQTQTVLGFLPSPAYYEAKTEQFSQELRLSSKSTHIAGIAATWTAGLYYSSQRRAFTDNEFIPGLQATFQSIFGYSIDSSASILGPTYYPATSAMPGISFANDLINYAHATPKEEQIAPFGEVGLQIAPSLKAAVGLRYVSARSSEGVTSAGFYGYGLPPQYTVSGKYSATTPKFSLEYALNESSNLYMTIAKGFRLGGPTGPVPAFAPNGPPPATPGTCDPDYQTFGLNGAPKQYDSDSLWSYEVGSKGRYFNNRLSVNAAVYAINWTNIQQTINLPTCGYLFTTNVGGAKVYGSELELRALVNSNVTLGLNAGSTHAYISSVSPEGAGIVSPGEWVLNVPLYTITPSIDYSLAVNDRTTLFARSDFPYTGRSRGYFDSSGLSHVFQPGYGIVNASVGFVVDRFSLSVYAKNLLNWQHVIQYPSVNSVQQGYTVRPATFGLAMSMRF